MFETFIVNEKQYTYPPYAQGDSPFVRERQERYRAFIEQAETDRQVIAELEGLPFAEKMRRYLTNVGLDALAALVDIPTVLCNWGNGGSPRAEEIRAKKRLTLDGYLQRVEQREENLNFP